MLLSEILNQLDFDMVTRTSTDFWATSEHVLAIKSGDSVKINYYHDGDIGFTFMHEGDSYFENVVHHNPTAKDLFDYVCNCYSRLGK